MPDSGVRLKPSAGTFKSSVKRDTLVVLSKVTFLVFTSNFLMFRSPYLDRKSSPKPSKRFKF